MPNISKVFQTTISEQGRPFFEYEGLLGDHQFAFQSHYLIGDLVDLDNDGETFLRHLTELTSFEIFSPPLPPISSFLSNRTILVWVDGFSPRPFTVNDDVPQDSPFAPTPLLSFVDELTYLLTSTLSSPFSMAPLFIVFLLTALPDAQTPTPSMTAVSPVHL